MLLIVQEAKVIKQALASIRGNLKSQAKDWQDNWQITIPAKAKANTNHVLTLKV